MTERAAHRHQRGAKQGALSCIIFPFISSPDPRHRNFFNDDEQHDNRLIDGGISVHFHWLPTWFSLQLYCGEPATLHSSCSSWLDSTPPHVPHSSRSSLLMFLVPLITFLVPLMFLAPLLALLLMVLTLPSSPLKLLLEKASPKFEA